MVLMCVGVLFLGFAQAVIVNSFEEVIKEHRHTKKPDRALKR